MLTRVRLWSLGEFRVLTDPGTGRGVRSIVYPIGEWEEPFNNSELFGPGEKGVVIRHTSWEEHPEWGQGLTVFHGRAQLEHIRDTFMGQAGLRGAQRQLKLS
jgi:hypothetical protein